MRGGNTALALSEKASLKGELAPAIEATLWDYAKGKPKEQGEVGGELRISWQWPDSDAIATAGALPCS